MQTQTQTECVQCGAVDERDHGILVGLVGELNEPMCNICRGEQLEDATPLTKREAEVYALKELAGLSHAQVAEFLDLEKSTVDTLSQRIGERVSESERLAALGGV